MRLSKLKYAELEGSPQEWVLNEFSLAETNLIVGKNASGKTRTLNVIGGLARHLAGVKPIPLSGNYSVEFIKDQQKIHYHLKYEDQQVITEKYEIDGNVLLDRGEGGKGTIWAEELKQNIHFQTPTTELAAVARQDSIQHKFLEPLRSWASSVGHYYFGTSLGKEDLAILVKKEGPKPPQQKPENLVTLYKQAESELSGKLQEVLIQDLRKINYDIETIGIKPPISIRLSSNLPGEIVGLYVKEKDLLGITDQGSMSQGMFRVLSLLMQVNYSQMTGKPTCILIDDIGEGLDFDRSCRLIDLLREKTKSSKIQLILTTNDRFIMNRVPLEEWSVIRRERSQVTVLNHDNSKEIFDEFKFTGLSNFSFLEMDFASGSPNEETEE